MRLSSLDASLDSSHVTTAVNGVFDLPIFEVRAKPNSNVTVTVEVDLYSVDGSNLLKT